MFAPHHRAATLRGFAAGLAFLLFLPPLQPALRAQTPAQSNLNAPPGASAPRRLPPKIQIHPEPRHGASFRVGAKTVLGLDGGGQGMRRPFLYPVLGPAGLPLTRLGHPHDPISHSHHNSIWISHNQIGEHNFWADQGGTIEVRHISRIEDGDTSAFLECRADWVSSTGTVVLHENRRISLTLISPTRWRIDLETELEADSAPMLAGTSGFGFLGVRMAKTIGVHDGGGRILNSGGDLNEKACFRKPARWVDYSGPVTDSLDEGITLMDHPQNPNHPVPFHVRNDGWMGPCSTLKEPYLIETRRPLRLKYGLLIHSNDITPTLLEEEWNAFSKTEFLPFPNPRSNK